jgi:LacI family transcriptional regulator
MTESKPVSAKLTPANPASSAASSEEAQATHAISPETQALIDEFLKLKRKATINDVARLAGVSKKTVSRVINKSPSVAKETREVVDDIIARLSFKPDPQARGLAFRRSFLLGLIYDNPNAQYVVNMQMGILDTIRGTGSELVVHPCDRNSPAFLDEIHEFVELQRLSGVIILPPIAEDRRLLALLEELDVPFIRVTARSGEASEPPIRTPQIVSRDRQGCAEAGEHLAHLGHTRIGYIAGNLLYPSAHERRAGFDEGLARLGQAIAPDLEEPGDYTFETGYKASLKILKNATPPTAIICANDETAAGAYKAAYELGLSIPDELSLVSFDDSPLASRLSPTLTSVHLPIRQMARQAAEMVLNRETTQKPSLVFDAVLKLRQSTGPHKPHS